MNAIEYMWSELKIYIHRHSTIGDIKLSNVVRLTEEAISQENWKNCCKYAADL